MLVIRSRMQFLWGRAFVQWKNMKFPGGMTVKVNCIDKKALFINMDDIFILLHLLKVSIKNANFCIYSIWKGNKIENVSDWLRRIICRTAGSESSLTGNRGNIVVSIGDTTVTWPQPFEYKVSLPHDFIQQRVKPYFVFLVQDCMWSKPHGYARSGSSYPSKG